MKLKIYIPGLIIFFFVAICFVTPADAANAWDKDTIIHSEDNHYIFGKAPVYFFPENNTYQFLFEKEIPGETSWDPPTFQFWLTEKENYGEWLGSQMIPLPEDRLPEEGTSGFLNWKSIAYMGYAEIPGDFGFIRQYYGVVGSKSPSGEWSFEDVPFSIEEDAFVDAMEFGYSHHPISRLHAAAITDDPENAIRLQYAAKRSDSDWQLYHTDISEHIHFFDKRNFTMAVCPNTGIPYMILPDRLNEGLFVYTLDFDKDGELDEYFLDIGAQIDALTATAMNGKLHLAMEVRDSTTGETEIQYCVFEDETLSDPQFVSKQDGNTIRLHSIAVDRSENISVSFGVEESWQSGSLYLAQLTDDAFVEEELVNIMTEHSQIAFNLSGRPVVSMYDTYPSNIYMLEKEPPLHTVDFSIVNAEGEEVPDANIRLNSQAYNYANAEGEYTFSVPPGEYDFFVSCPGYHLYRGSFDVTDDDMHVEAVLDMRLYHVLFVVRDAEGSQIDDATVTFLGITVENSPYSFSDVYPGDYEYTVSKEGFVTVDSTITIEEGDNYHVQEIVVLNEALYSVTFQVENEAGQLLTDAIITFDGIQNSPGEYYFGNIPPGSYSYTVEKCGYVAEGSSVVIDDADMELIVTLKEETTAVPAEKDNTKIHIYPNPATNLLNVVSDKTIDSLVLYNLNGSRILAKEGSSTHEQLDVSALADGVYMLSVHKDSDSIRKIIIITTQ